MARFDIRCPRCGHTKEVSGPIGSVPEVLCDLDQEKMVSYFGTRAELLFNAGFRPQNYANQVDRDIANFQFTNLA